MIGAITLSRIVTDPKISAAILDYTRKYLTASVRGRGVSEEAGGAATCRPGKRRRGLWQA
jgi:hypothetical protein